MTSEQLLKVIPTLTRSVLIDLIRKKHIDPTVPAPHPGSPAMFDFGQAMLLACYCSVRHLVQSRAILKALFFVMTELKEDTVRPKHALIPRTPDSRNPFKPEFLSDLRKRDEVPRVSIRISGSNEIVGVSYNEENTRTRIYTPFYFRLIDSKQISRSSLSAAQLSNIEDDPQYQLILKLNRIHLELKSEMKIAGLL